MSNEFDEYTNLSNDVFLLEDLPPFMIGFSHGMLSMIPKSNTLKESERLCQNYEDKTFYKTGDVVGKIVTAGSYITLATIWSCVAYEIISSL